MPTLTLNPGVSAATLLAGIANEGYDRIELTAGTYTGFANCVINVDRISRLAVKEAVPGTVTFDGTGSGGDGPFLFGYGGSASNIEFGPFTYDGYEVGETGVIWVGNADNLDLSGTPTRKQTVVNCFSGGAAPDATFSWALYLSKDAGVGSSNITANDWAVTGSGRDLSGLQLQYAELHTNIEANGWTVDHLAFALYSNAHATGVEYHDWSITDCGGYTSSVYFGNSFGTNTGHYSGLALIGSDPLVNESAGGMVDGGASTAIFDAGVFDPVVFLTGALVIVVPPGEITSGSDRAQRPAILPANLHLYAKNASDAWVEITAVQWEVEIDQALGQPTTATFTVQDREGTLDDDFDFTTGRIPVILEIGGTGVASGFILFQGEWLYDTVHLGNRFPWRRHELRATDYNRYLERKLVGAVDGKHWETSDNGESYQPVDPEARTSGITDRDTVRHLFDTYWKGPVTVDTDEFVTTNRGTFGRHPIFWDRTTLDAALEDLASRTTPRNIQKWLDMGDDPGKVFFHWIHIGPWWQQTGPQGMVRNPLELAPRNIDNDNPDYDTSIPVSGLEWSFDATGRVDEVYSNGWAAFAYNFDDPSDPALFGGGWYPNEEPVFTGEQEFMDFVGPNMSEDVKINYGNRVLQRTGRALLRGSYTVTCTDPDSQALRWHDLDDWHPGQKQTISDIRMPDALRGKTFAIQGVRSTLVKGTRMHRHVVEWGDAPRLRPFRFPAAKTPAKKPTRTMLVTWNVNTPIPGRTYKVEAQAISEIGEPWAIQGAKVEWGLLVEDFAADIVVEGSIVDATTGTAIGKTDSRGKAVARVTIGARADRIYTPIADFYP